MISGGRLASGAFDLSALCFLNRGDEIYECNKVIDTETNILHVCTTQRIGK